MRTIFPKCFGSHYILRRHYFVYAIFGFAAMAAINYLISGRKKAVDVFVVEEHHEGILYIRMGNFVHTAFKAYCGVLLGPV